MLSFLGYGMIVVFMILIMTKKLSALTALTIIPILFALIAGFGGEMGDMMIETAGAAAYAVVFALDKGRHPAFIHAAMASLPEKKSVHAQAE